MRKFFNLVLGGIQHKIFNVFLVTMILVVAAFVSVIVFQTQSLEKIVSDANKSQREAAVGIATQTVDSIVESELLTTTTLYANLSDQLFSNLGGKMTILGDSLRGLASNADLMGPAQVLGPDASKNGSISVQLLFAEGIDPNNPEIAKKVGLYGNLSSLMESICATNNINSCFIGTPEGIFIIADNVSAAKIDEEGKVKSFPVTERPWYIGAVEKGGLFFSDVEKDSFSDNYGIVCSYPVYVDGKLVAVVGADLFVGAMADYVESSAADGGFICIINQNGHVVFAPATQGIFPSSSKYSDFDMRTSPSKELSSLVSNALEAPTGLVTVKVGLSSYFMVGCPIPSVGWTVISVVDKALLSQPANMLVKSLDDINEEATEAFDTGINESRTTLLVLLAGIFVVGAAGALLLAGRIVKPLGDMTKEIQDINGDHLDFEMKDKYRTKDEIEVLAKAFADLTIRTHNYIDQITHITAEKERIGAELNVATQIQADMLPRIFPPYPEKTEFDLYASMNPAKEVGGDFYDFFLVDDNHIALVMADVSGKGVPAALFMVIAKTLLKNRAQAGGTPSEILEDVNKQLCEGNDAELFVTVWMAIIDFRTGEGVAANAGHEHPTLRHKDGKFELIVYNHSPAVAMIDGMMFKDHSFQLKPGDSLFVYTDGVAEATDSNLQLFGTDRMVDALNKEPDAAPRKIVENVAEELAKFTEGAEQFDDITMLCFKYNGPKPDVKVIEVDAVVTNLDSVLAFVDEELEKLDCPMKDQMQIDVAVEELFTNIASYAYDGADGKAWISVHPLKGSNGIEISLSDRGKFFDPLAKEDPDINLPAEERQIGGLGIYMVKKSMDDVRYEYKDGMNIVTLVKKF